MLTVYSIVILCYSYTAKSDTSELRKMNQFHAMEWFYAAAGTPKVCRRATGSALDRRTIFCTKEPSNELLCSGQYPKRKLGVHHKAPWQEYAAAPNHFSEDFIQRMAGSAKKKLASVFVGGLVFPFWNRPLTQWNVTEPAHSKREILAFDIMRTWGLQHFLSVT